jgi:hypothetical protein
MSTRWARALPLTGLAAAALFLAPGPGSVGAAPKAEAECPPDSLCVWAKPNYRGERLVIDRLGPSNKIYRKLNDQVSSARLRYAGYATLFEDVNGEGNSLCLLDAPGLRRYPELNSPYDDSISSSLLSENPTSFCF